MATERLNELIDVLECARIAVEGYEYADGNPGVSRTIGFVIRELEKITNDMAVASMWDDVDVDWNGVFSAGAGQPAQMELFPDLGVNDDVTLDLTVEGALDTITEYKNVRRD